MRALALFLALAAAGGAAPSAPASAAKPEFVEAVEFPYYLLPAATWERELVRLKNTGVRTVEFSIPWNWHQLHPGEFDFTGRTSPRRDLVGLLRLLRELGLHAWVRPLPPVSGWLNGGWPAGTAPGSAAMGAWLAALGRLLSAQTASHGGAVAYVEGRPLASLAIDAGPPPARVTVVSAGDPGALVSSRDAVAAAAGQTGALLWTGVEDEFYPAGWAAYPALSARPGQANDGGVFAGALGRASTLLRNWSPLLGGLRPVAVPKPSAGKLPAGIRVTETISHAASAVSIANTGKETFRGDLAVATPFTKRALVIPGVTVPPGESLWLPVAVSLGPNGLCRECANFSAAENVVYATAELVAVEYENGVLAMEFAAPEKGEAVLQLAREPVGPYLAAGKPMEFAWDDQSLRVRLPIPAGKAPGYRVRIGLAIEEPDAAGFFNDARRLLIGGKNVLSTVYSSPELAQRSRLRLPEGFTARPVVKSPNGIDYEIAVPPDALSGDWADLTLEADGAPLGRARLELFRPVSIRLPQAIALHFGPRAAVAPDPPTAAADIKAGANVEVALRNNSLEIQTYHLEASGDGLEFLPAATDIAVGALAERSVALRIFSAAEAPPLHLWRLRVSGGASADVAMRVLALPRNGSVVWSADLDGDGSPEWALESQKVRAVFSARDGGRWMEFTSKTAGANFLPEQGVFAAPGPVEVQPAGDALEFTGRNWERTVRLTDGALTIEQTTPLPPDPLVPEKRAAATLSIERISPSKVVYTLK
ncbi:MAG: beta-galactosidase [Bryobacteraceae bacterium]|jgi:hypothetical protein